MKYVFLIILLLGSLYLKAQKITGIVCDEQNMPIEFATILLKTDTLKVNATFTNSKGFFSFDHLRLNQKYRVQISFIGYDARDTSILLLKDFTFNIKLLKNNTLLKEIIIKDKKPLIERKVDRLVFNVENRLNGIGSDALDVLAKTPLVKVDNETITLMDPV